MSKDNSRVTHLYPGPRSARRGGVSASHVAQSSPRSVEQLGDGGDHPPGGRAAALAQHGHVDLHYKLALPLQYNTYTGLRKMKLKITLMTHFQYILRHLRTLRAAATNELSWVKLLSHNFSAVPPLHFAIFAQPMRRLATGWEPIRARDQHK